MYRVHHNIKYGTVFTWYVYYKHDIINGVSCLDMITESRRNGGSGGGHFDNDGISHVIYLRIVAHRPKHTIYAHSWISHRVRLLPKLNLWSLKTGIWPNHRVNRIPHNIMSTQKGAGPRRKKMYRCTELD